MEFFEELIGEENITIIEENISLIIGGALVVLAVIALVWMYLWYEKTKEYNKILKSIDDKVDISNKEELKKELKTISQGDSEEKSTEEQGKTDASEKTTKPEDEETKNDVDEKENERKAPEVKHNFMRAMAAIETLEKDELEKAGSCQGKASACQETEKPVEGTEMEEAVKSENQDSSEDVVDIAKKEAKKIQDEIFRAARKNEAVKETSNDQLVEVKTVEIPDDMNVSEGDRDDLSMEDEECKVDVFDEIRKMLVETEKNPVNEFSIAKEEPESENVAKSGKEYTREELEDLIKF